MTGRGRVRRAAASLFNRSASWGRVYSSDSRDLRYPETASESEFQDTTEFGEEQVSETEPEYHVPAPEQGMPGRWVAHVDTEARRSRARTLVRLLDLQGAVQPEVAMVLIAAGEAAPAQPGGRVIAAIPGLMAAQVLQDKPDCLLIDEAALGREPWGVPSLGPHRSTIDELTDLAKSPTSGESLLLVRVRMQRIEEPEGPFGLDNGYREVRRSVPFEMEAGSWHEIFSLLDSFRELSTWESHA